MHITRSRCSLKPTYETDMPYQEGHRGSNLRKYKEVEIGISLLEFKGS